MRRLIPQSVLLIFTMLFCAGIIIIPMACSGSQRQKTIRASVVAVSASREAWVAWDRQHQLDIVKESTTKDEVDAKLAAYRHQRDDLMTAYTVAYEGLALASTQADDPSLKKALQQADVVLDILRALGVKL
jgi:hypothetical protein